MDIDHEEQDKRKLKISDFILSAKQNTTINHYVIDGQHRSGNNFWNILFTYNTKGHEHKLFGESFHNPELYKISNKYNYLDNVFNIIPFREPWEATKSFLVLTNREEGATEEHISSYLDTCEAFYDTILLEENNIIPIELGFGSANAKKIVCHILSLGKEDSYNSFEDMRIGGQDSLRNNHIPLDNKNKADLIKKAEKQMSSPKIIRHVSEVSKKYYNAKLYARHYWLERGI